VLEKEHAYVIYEIHKCSEKTRKNTDPECETMENINNWLSTISA